MRAPVAVAIVLAACNHAPGDAVVDAAATGDSSGVIDASAALVDAAPADAGPCGTRTDRRGKTSRTVQAGGLTRTYTVYVPADVDPATPIPLVYVFHGYTMSGAEMYSLTGYPAIADSDHIALAFPDGQGGPDSLGAPWNVGSDICPSVGNLPPPAAAGDDFAFMDAMRADIATDQCIDGDHVFATGFSMGGYLAHHIGCERPDIRAVAPHSGGTHDLAACPNAKKPIIIFHGISDPVIPEGCDDPAGTKVGTFTPSAKAWAAHNGCAATFTSRTVENGTCITYDDCPVGGQVELCTFTTMGHCWAGGGDGSIYACPSYESATTLQWDFFKTYAW